MDSLSVYSTCVTVAKQLLTAKLPNPYHKEWQGWVPQHQLIDINSNHTNYSLMHWSPWTQWGPRQSADTTHCPRQDNRPAPVKLKCWISSRIPVLQIFLHHLLAQLLFLQFLNTLEEPPYLSEGSSAAQSEQRQTKLSNSASIPFQN